MNKLKPTFAFLVHPRHRRDIFRKFPYMRYFPNWLMWLFERYWRPTLVSRITGLHTTDTHEELEGIVISIPMSAPTALTYRDAALAQIRSAVRVAQKKGAKIIGLGALTSSLSAGGRHLTDIDGITITSGHAYTGHTVSSTLLSAYADMNIELSDAVVGIVGAAGSIGTVTTELLADAGVGKIFCIDIERKLPKVHKLKERLESTYPNTAVEVSTDLEVLKHATGIVTVTNTPDALVESKHVVNGTIIVDDAQPSDVAPELFEREHVLVLEAGAVRTPGVTTNFNMGLMDRHDNFCCLGEVLILAANHRTKEHFVGATATLEAAKEMGRQGSALGFTLAPRQNEHGLISNEQFETVTTQVRKRLS